MPTACVTDHKEVNHLG